MTTRLNKSTKETIVKTAIKDIFKEREEALMLEESALMQQILRHSAVKDQEGSGIAAKTVRDMVNQYNDKFGNILTVTNNVISTSYLILSKISFGKRHEIRNFLTPEGKVVRSEGGDLVPQLITLYSTGGRHFDKGDLTKSQLTKVYSFLLSRHSLEEDIRKMTSKLTACVSGITTVTKLINTYPDLEKYVPNSAKSTGIILSVSPHELTAEMEKMRARGTKRTKR